MSSKAFSRARPAMRIWCALLLAVAAYCWGGGCASAPPPGVIKRSNDAAAVPSANVSANQAWRDVKMVAGHEPGRLPVVGTGKSMQPIYGDNTMLVINTIAYEDLRAGMTVVYMNRRGLRVAHQLVEKITGGWRVKSLNNERFDEELVTPENLVGVVYASFNYDVEE